MVHNFCSNKSNSKSEILHCLDRLGLDVEGDLDVFYVAAAWSGVDVAVDPAWFSLSASGRGADGNRKDRHKQCGFDDHPHGEFPVTKCLK